MLSREDFVYLSWLIVDLSGTRCPVVFTHFGVFHAKSLVFLLCVCSSLLPVDLGCFDTIRGCLE